MQLLDEYLQRGIKEIIDSHPQVIEILNEYGIGCGACDVGTCLLKDIVSLHPLSKEKEHELMERLAAKLWEYQNSGSATKNRINQKGENP